MNNPITSIDQLLELMKVVRLYKRGYITNFFLDEFKHDCWIKNGELFYDQVGYSIFLIRKTDSFNALFFLSTNAEDLSSSLAKFTTEVTAKTIVDLVGTESVTSIKKIFEEAGFGLYNSLHRMSRCGKIAVRTDLPLNVCDAEMYDHEVIELLLRDFFDPLAEQLPSGEELAKWITDKLVLVYKVEHRIVGFIIYELLGVTLYLRYWFVHPDFREQKIGSDLFTHFLDRGKDTKRQLFWVIDSNDNAIKRYEHYGFVSEKMYDYVLVKNN